jgi:hypothetical protein
MARRPIAMSGRRPAFGIGGIIALVPPGRAGKYDPMSYGGVRCLRCRTALCFGLYQPNRRLFRG